jgi:hypothetical protein
MCGNCCDLCWLVVYGQQGQKHKIAEYQRVLCLWLRAALGMTDFGLLRKNAELPDKKAAPLDVSG